MKINEIIFIYKLKYLEKMRKKNEEDFKDMILSYEHKNIDSVEFTAKSIDSFK